MKVLTAAGQELQEDFKAHYEHRGCYCHINPPCSYCTHPGHPEGLANSEDLWEEVDSINNE